MHRRKYLKHWIATQFTSCLSILMRNTLLLLRSLLNDTLTSFFLNCAMYFKTNVIEGESVERVERNPLLISNSENVINLELQRPIVRVRCFCPDYIYQTLPGCWTCVYPSTQDTKNPTGNQKLCSPWRHGYVIIESERPVDSATGTSRDFALDKEKAERVARPPDFGNILKLLKAPVWFLKNLKKQNFTNQIR